MTTSRSKRTTTGATPSWRRLVLLLVGVLVLVLPATMALASNANSEDKRADRAEQADKDDEDDKDKSSSHCEDGEGSGHRDCKPDNNPQPENPPCDADHGHPAENAKQCQEGPDNPGSCSDGEDNDGDGLIDDDDPDCQEGEGPCADAGGDTDGDGVCDDDDECPNEAADTENGCPDDGGPCADAGGDTDGDGVCDDDDECPNEAADTENGCPEDPTTQNLCTAAADDPGLPLTEDTLGQTLWDSGLDALDPLTEDPERNGPLSGAIGDGGTGTPLEPVTDEVACAVDLLINESTGADL